MSLRVDTPQVSLAHLPLFASLTPAGLERVESLFHRVDVDPDTVLMREGDVGDRLYVVLEGQLAIIVGLDTPEEHLAGHRGPGDVIGEMSLLTGEGVRNASVRVRTPSRLLELTHADFDTLLERHPRFAYELLRMLSARLRNSHQAMIRDLQAHNRQLAQANADLQAAQAQVVAEAQARARLEEEMHVAQMIQQQFLPRELPTLAEWQIAPYYQAAGAVGGDFYDFIELPDGRLGLVVGDVTGKGVPAALVMATTQSMLRGEAPRHAAPGAALVQINERLVREIPEHMFATCLYAILDPATGQLQVANAGHNYPYLRTAGGIGEIRARGMPLGLLPGRIYEEVTVTLEPGDAIALYSDGLVEAHNAAGEMFGFPRLEQAFAHASREGTTAIDALIHEVEQFAGDTEEQDDDMTLVIVRRAGRSD